MRLHVSVQDGKPIYLQIVEQIKYLAAAGRLTEGERLPAVRKLAEELLINPNTVARAYRELESEGYVLSRRGSGVFVNGAGSRLNEREQIKILAERADILLAEAKQMKIGLETLFDLMRERQQILESSESE